jgi:hypothetical protein
LLGQVGQGLVDFGVRDLVDRLGQLDRRGVDRLEVRHHFHGQFEGQVLAAGEHLVHVGRGLQVRLAGGAQLVVVQHLLGAFVQRRLDDFAHQGLAIEAANVGRRHLARAEALDVHLGRDLGDPGFEARGEFTRGHRHAINAAEAFARLFNDLHRHS